MRSSSFRPEVAIRQPDAALIDPRDHAAHASGGVLDRADREQRGEAVDVKRRDSRRQRLRILDLRDRREQRLERREARLLDRRLVHARAVLRTCRAAGAPDRRPSCALARGSSARTRGLRDRRSRRSCASPRSCRRGSRSSRSSFRTRTDRSRHGSAVRSSASGSSPIEASDRVVTDLPGVAATGGSSSPTGLLAAA